MNIVIACDPNANEFKELLKNYIIDLGHQCTDYGSDDVIYARAAVKAAEAVANGEFDRGILICGTGIGVSIAANKVKGAYAALVNNIYQAQRAQLSNNANIMAMGSQVTGIELAKCLVKEYLQTEFVPNTRSGPKLEAVYRYEDGEEI